MTPDISTAVDVFERNPAELWNMPVERPFGRWNVVGLFNFDMDEQGTSITRSVRFEDLDLAADKEYLVHEFWSGSFLGSLTGGFERTLAAPDCEIYSIVERRDHPVLVSTNRNVRNMAYDVVGLEWDATSCTLRGESKVVGDDPYELRVFVPKGYEYAEAHAEGLEAAGRVDGDLVHVRFVAPVNRDVAWRVQFRERS